MIPKNNVGVCIKSYTRKCKEICSRYKMMDYNFFKNKGFGLFKCRIALLKYFFKKLIFNTFK